MREKRKKALVMTLTWIFALLAGVANGFFGAGGGMLVVPCLHYVRKVDERKSHATAIAVILPLSVISSVVYALRGVSDVKKGLYVSLGVTLGGVIGAILLRRVPKRLLTFVFYGVMIYAGVRFIV